MTAADPRARDPLRDMTMERVPAHFARGHPGQVGDRHPGYLRCESATDSEAGNPVDDALDPVMPAGGSVRARCPDSGGSRPFRNITGEIAP